MSNELSAWDEIESQNSSVTTEQLDLLVKEYREARTKYEENQAVGTKLYKEFQEKEGKLVEAMSQAKKQKYYVEGIGMVSFRNTRSVQTPKTIEAKKAFFNWIRAEFGDTVLMDKLSIHSATINKIYNDAVTEAEEKGVDTSLFSIPGLSEPTVTTNLVFKKENK
jgi:hypothetical protein